jgi:hypothetical protein
MYQGAQFEALSEGPNIRSPPSFLLLIVALPWLISAGNYQGLSGQATPTGRLHP